MAFGFYHYYFSVKVGHQLGWTRLLSIIQQRELSKTILAMDNANNVNGVQITTVKNCVFDSITLKYCKKQMFIQSMFSLYF